jgi:hypothetical protein
MLMTGRAAFSRESIATEGAPTEILNIFGHSFRRLNFI